MEESAIQQILMKNLNFRFSGEKVLKSRFMEVVHKAEIVWKKVLGRSSNQFTMQPVLHTIAQRYSLNGKANGQTYDDGNFVFSEKKRGGPGEVW